MKLYLWILIVSAIFFSGCSTEQEILNPDGDTKKGKLTFTFPTAKSSKTYGISSAAEESLNLDNMFIYMVNTDDTIEQVFSPGTGGMSTDPGSVSDLPSATIMVSSEDTGDKRFYFVANISSVSSGLSSIKKGSRLDDLLKLVTDVQSVHLSATEGGLLLTGCVLVSAADLSSDTPTRVSLKRRVARFDISNNADSSLITINQLIIVDAHLSALAFADKDSLPASYGDLPSLSFSASSLANRTDTDTTSVFYLYPSDTVDIRLLATVDGISNLYRLPLPDGGIKANKRYIIKTKDPKKPGFELIVDEWDDTSDIEPVFNPQPSFSNIVSSNPVGWDPVTRRFDATNGGTTITMDVLTQSSAGVGYEIVGAPSDYIGVTMSTATMTYAASYKQSLTVTIPQYAKSAPLQAEVIIRDKTDPLKEMKISAHATGILTFGNIKLSTNSTFWSADTRRFDATDRNTVITMDVFTPTSQGAQVSVSPADGYSLSTTLLPATATLTADGSYKQVLTITAPKHARISRMDDCPVVVKNKANLADAATVATIFGQVNYYPTKHNGWAGSNIYWDGSKLTFDDSDNRTNEKRQGVYFQWGSLWGISPQGGWDVTNAATGTILYPPTGGSKTAYAAGYTVSTDWSKIPRILDGLLTPADGKNLRNWAYAYQITNDSVARGKGDICKHLTDQAGGTLHGKKWRMPTSQEFEAAADYTPNKVGDFVAQVSNLADGTFAMNSGYRKGSNPVADPFFPASGNRNSTGGLSNVGSNGNYWSGSPGGNAIGSYYLDFTSSDVTPAGSAARARGLAVRCVAE